MTFLSVRCRGHFFHLLVHEILSTPCTIRARWLVKQRNFITGKSEWVYARACIRTYPRGAFTQWHGRSFRKGESISDASWHCASRVILAPRAASCRARASLEYMRARVCVDALSLLCIGWNAETLEWAIDRGSIFFACKALRGLIEIHASSQTPVGWLAFGLYNFIWKFVIRCSLTVIRKCFCLIVTARQMIIWSWE